MKDNRVIGFVLALGVACARPGPPASPETAASASPRANVPGAASLRMPPDHTGGMWLPEQIGSQSRTLRELGLAIDMKQLSDPSSDVLGAVVNFSGCSASFVSPDGLIITNHHCATRALQYNSDSRNNLIDLGFRAETRKDERSSGPTARVLVTVAIHDVTKDVNAALAGVADDLARQLAYEKKQKESVARCERERPNRRCQLISFYDGYRYSLIERLELRDVRMVYVPPEGIGNFGGEIDNWRWPRHAGDFAFFRAYVDENGNPADYSPDNVPYRPPHVLKVAQSGLRDGDLVLVLGYPGQTSRMKARREVEDVITWLYPRRLAMFDAYLKRLEALGATDPEARLRATPWIRGFNNYRTKHQGELEGMREANLLDVKREQEQRLQRFFAKDSASRSRYGGVLEQMEAALAEFAKTREPDTALQVELAMPRLLAAATRIVRMAEERQRPDAEREADYQERNVPTLRNELQAVDKVYARAVDEAMLGLALERILATAREQRSAALEIVAGRNPTPESIRRSVARLYAGTKLADPALRLGLFENATPAELARHPDPLLQLAVKLRPRIREAELRQKRLNGKLLVLRPLYMEALLALLGPTPPDANGTLRISFGTVRARSDAADERPFTGVSGIAKKHRSEPPFDAPGALLSAIAEQRYGRYADPALGEVPVDFLSDANITNGNSGSPTLNARGELTGVAFDGTYESVASDWVYLPSARSIHVDIRYVLWVLEHVAQNRPILQELGVLAR